MVGGTACPIEYVTTCHCRAVPRNASTASRPNSG